MMRSRPTRRRRLARALPSVLGFVVLASGPALPQASDHNTRPVEVVVKVRDQAPRCEPQELRVPAEANLDLRIQNLGTRSVAVRAPELFSDRTTLAAANATETEGGYVVNGGQNAQLQVRSPPSGQYPFTCSDADAREPQTTGTLTTVR